jgi:hypothetical protein
MDGFKLVIGIKGRMSLWIDGLFIDLSNVACTHSWIDSLNNNIFIVDCYS